MKLCGENIKHKVFGKGKIVEFENNYITILFDKTKELKKFKYPDAIGKFLELQKDNFDEQINDDKKVLKKEKDRKQKVHMEHLDLLFTIKREELNKKAQKGKNSKTSDKNNIAFKCSFCDGGQTSKLIGFNGICSDIMIKNNIEVDKRPWCRSAESQCKKYLDNEITRDTLEERYLEDDFKCHESKMLGSWRAYAGITQRGKNKDKPMKLKNVNSNSLAILTTKLPKTGEEERLIFAIFLIDKYFEGDDVTEGYVEAKGKYKIQLSLDEIPKLKFWEFFFSTTKPEKIAVGTGLHRYLTEVQSAQILKKICEIKEGTEDEVIAKEFLKYYCSYKKIDIDNIPDPVGALTRVEDKS